MSNVYDARPILVYSQEAWNNLMDENRKLQKNIQELEDKLKKCQEKPQKEAPKQES